MVANIWIDNSIVEKKAILVGTKLFGMMVFKVTIEILTLYETILCDKSNRAGEKTKVRKILMLNGYYYRFTCSRWR